MSAEVVANSSNCTADDRCLLCRIQHSAVKSMRTFVLHV